MLQQQDWRGFGAVRAGGDTCTHARTHARTDPHHFATDLKPEELYREAEITTSDNIAVTIIHMHIKDTSQTQDKHR